MHLIDVIVTHADGRTVAARAVWCGDPAAAVDGWRAEMAARSEADGTPCPSLASAHRPTTAAEVDALRRAGQAVLEFPGWDAPDPLAAERERVEAIRGLPAADRHPALVAEAVERGWSAEKAELVILRAETIAGREREQGGEPGRERSDDPGDHPAAAARRVRERLAALESEHAARPP